MASPIGLPLESLPESETNNFTFGAWGEWDVRAYFQMVRVTARAGFIYFLICYVKSSTLRVVLSHLAPKSK